MKTVAPERDKVRLYFDDEFWGDANETVLDAGSAYIRVDATKKNPCD
jgi:hypothetical protein